jgi:hypothetical protein
MKGRRSLNAALDHHKGVIRRAVSGRKIEIRLPMPPINDILQRSLQRDEKGC